VASRQRPFNSYIQTAEIQAKPVATIKAKVALHLLLGWLLPTARDQDDQQPSHKVDPANTRPATVTSS